MKLENITIGLCITGSFCNFNMTKDVIRSLMQEGATVIPIISNNVKKLDTRFYKAKEIVQMVEDETKNKVIDITIPTYIK